MIIGIGSKNKAKVFACKKAFNDLNQKFDFFNKNVINYLATETQTSIPEMPLNRNDLKKGALERALFVYKKYENENNPIDFAVGMEGGTFRENENTSDKTETYLQSLVYIYNGKTGYYGTSPTIPLPMSIAHALYNENRELADIMDEFSGQEDVRSNQGAFGILTRNLITRDDSFYLAVINAMVPFLNKKYYHHY